MADTRNVRQTDDLRLRGLLNGSGMGMGGYMFNLGEEAPSNMPLSAFERGVTRAPLSSFNEIDAPDVGDDPMVTGGVEDDIFDMLSQIMVGTQGTIEGLDPETVAMLRGAIDPSAGTEELQAIAEAIEEAGGYEEWLAQQPTGDAGGDVGGDASGGAGTSTDTEEGGEVVIDPSGSTVDDEDAETAETIPTDDGADNLPGDTTEEDGEQESGEEDEEGWLDRLSNWWDSVLNSIGGGTSGSTPPTLPGSSGVIISPGSAGMSWPDIIANPGAWQVYLPGVIPGLPQSPTIIGTIGDILSSPGEVLGDLWDQIQNTVENPGEFLEDLLNGVVDDDGLITIGGISTVVGIIYDDLFGDDDTTTTPGGVDDTQTTVPGGAEEEEEEDQGPVKGDPIKQAPLQPDPVEGDLPLTGDGPVKGDPIKQAPISDEPQPELGGNDDDSSGGGGGGGGMMSGRPHRGGVGYALPQGQMIMYRPPTASEILTDFTNGLALQRKKGMLV